MSRLAPWAMRCAVTALTYVTLSRLALEWRGDLTPTPLWLATAGVTAVAIIARRPYAGWLLAGSLLGGVASSVWVYDESTRQLVAPVVANVVEIVVVSTLVRRWLPAGPSIRRTRDAVRLVGIVAVGVAASASLAVVDTASDVIGDRWVSWGRWALGNAIGQLLVIPIVLTRRSGFITSASTRGGVEIAVSTVVLVGLTAAGCAVEWPLLYLVAPVVMWLAIRFGPLLTAPFALAIAGAVTVVTGRGGGPFAELDDAVAQAQLFNLVIGLSSLVGGAHALRAWSDHERLAAVIASLPDTVLVRGADGEVLDAWVPDAHRHGITGLVPGSTAGVPLIDGPIPVTGGPQLLTSPSGTMFERRSASLDATRSIELYRDVTEEQRARQLVRSREEAIEAARVDEQERIAKEIHDSPLQLVIAARIRIEAMAEVVGPGEHADVLGGAVGLLRQAAAELRGQIVALMPSGLDHGDVMEALEQHARMVLDGTVEVETVSALDRRPDPTLAKLLYLAGREGISNVAKHTSASRIRIALVHRDGEHSLTIIDDGAGFDPAAERTRGIGLSVMRERVGACGGAVSIVGDTAGTTLTIVVPDAGDA